MSYYLWKTIQVIFEALAPMVVAVIAVAWLGCLVGLFIKIVMKVIN